MCGICGIIDFKHSYPEGKKETVVARMNKALRHRGPDAEGSYADTFCALAMRRLSIIDLPGGNQPVFNEEGNIGVFFNGEIYNYKELKATLLQRGHRFKTHSDTEVLVHLYEAYGESMLSLLKGMFAFCIYDLEQRTLFLARDRFGEKPLFYYSDENTFSFSSEIRSLLENDAVPRVLDPEALSYYFRTSLIPEPLTLFKGLKSLPPGHFMKLSGSGCYIKKYFAISYEVDNSIRTDEDACAFVRPFLINAISRQAVSDVPIGAFLSGGIDSSTVAALLQKHSGERIRTFTVRFEDQAFDESRIAGKVAEFLGTDHHELFVPNFDFNEDIFWEIIDGMGMPFRDSSAIPFYFIAREIRRQVKVALSGDGGDELFGGYNLFQWYRKIIGLKSIPRPLRQLGGLGLGFFQKLPVISNAAMPRQIKRALRTSLQDPASIPVSLNEMFSECETADMTCSYFRVTGRPLPFDYPVLKTYPEESRLWTPLRKIMYYRAVHTLPANMLVKVDRMSMANSLEVRAPFLDPDLFEASATLPDRFLLRNGTGKYILRKIMETQLPEEVFSHPKQGFSIPLYKYQNASFFQLAKRLLYHENPLPGLIEKRFLDEIYLQGSNSRKRNANLSVFRSTHRLWMMMQLFGWAQRFNVTL